MKSLSALQSIFVGFTFAELPVRLLCPDFMLGFELLVDDSFDELLLLLLMLLLSNGG